MVLNWRGVDINVVGGGEKNMKRKYKNLRNRRKCSEKSGRMKITSLTSSIHHPYLKCLRRHDERYFGVRGGLRFYLK
jgi:hypothetical protein